MMISEVVLVVDDDAFQRNVLEKQLESIGYANILLASSGQEALNYYDHYAARIGVVICDLSMPEMDGIVLMRHLTQRGMKSPIILLSGIEDEILVSAAGLANAHGLEILGVLRKPCSVDKLKELLLLSQVNTTNPRCANYDEIISEKRLTQALADSEFIPWYQPKIDVRNGKTVGVEALARWPMPDGSLISPSVFIPAHEAAGLADELFFVIARQVMADMAVWQKQNIYFKTSINMSMDSSLNLELPERLVNIVREYGLQPSDIIIEVTESRLMVERSLAMETLTRLSLLGFILSIDDFGTGYSSLIQLIDLPFKEIKIDGSFVQRSDSERKAQAIVRIAVMLGNQLGMTVVAEGVETYEQLNFITECGGLIVQGYLFARPMPFRACTAWLHKR